VVTASPPGDGRFVTGTPDVADRSFGELIGQVTRDMSTLVQQEMTLARAELREDAARAGRASGMFAAAAVAANLVLVFLSVALWQALANVMDPGWAALIVAVIWAVVAGILFAVARERMTRLRGLPRTVETVREIPQAFRPDTGGTR